MAIKSSRQENSGNELPAARTGRKKHKPALILVDLIIIALVLAGGYLLLKPVYLHWQQDRLTKKLVDAFNSGNDSIVINPNDYIVPGEEVDNFGETEALYPDDSSTTTDTSDTIVTEPGATTKSRPTPTPIPPVKITAIGKIKISKINLSMPIAEGATLATLRVAIGHYNGSAKPGQPGLCILFGHRMYTYGRHFNRLGEVGQGDTIVLEDKTSRYTYLVEENVAILPKDLPAAMTVSTSEARLMLVTCTPVRIASHRMLVKAYLIKTEKLG